MITSQTLTLAKEALITAATQRQELLVQNNNLASKISELEQEIQSLASILSETQLKLSDVQQENSSLRSRIPDAATERAFEELTGCLSNTSEMRIAA